MGGQTLSGRRERADARDAPGRGRRSNASPAHSGGTVPHGATSSAGHRWRSGPHHRVTTEFNTSVKSGSTPENVSFTRRSALV